MHNVGGCNANISTTVIGNVLLKTKTLQCNVSTGGFEGFETYYFANIRQPAI